MPRRAAADGRFCQLSYSGRSSVFADWFLENIDRAIMT